MTTALMMILIAVILMAVVMVVGPDVKLKLCGDKWSGMLEKI
jgi:hypothetical protein